MSYNYIHGPTLEVLCQRHSQALVLLKLTQGGTRIQKISYELLGWSLLGHDSAWCPWITPVIGVYALINVTKSIQDLGIQPLTLDLIYQLLVA